MNVAFINPFIMACREVFDTMVHVPITLGKPQLRDTDARPSKISVVMILSGAVEGIVVIGISDRVATALVGGLTGSPCHQIDADAIDALGEVANMVVGSAKKNLPGGLSTISVPKVIKSPTQVPYPGGLPVITIPFDTAPGRFVIEVSLKMTAEAAAVKPVKPDKAPAPAPAPASPAPADAAAPTPAPTESPAAEGTAKPKTPAAAKAA